MTFATLNDRRKSLEVSGHKLVTEAGFRPHLWYLWRKGMVPRDSTLRRLNAALDRLEAGTPAQKRDRIGLKSSDTALIAASYRGFFVAICRHFDASPERLLLHEPSRQTGKRFGGHNDDPEWMLASKVRALAVYCTVIEFDLRQADLARAIGMTRQAISLMLHRVEDYRDDPAIDKLLDDAGALLNHKAETGLSGGDDVNS